MGIPRWPALALALPALVLQSAQGASIDFQTSAGSSLFTNRLSIDTRPNSRRESGIVGDAAVSLASSSIQFRDFGEVTDRTYTLNGSLGWKFNRSWEAGLMINLSSTPAESLQQGGGTLYGEWTHYFGGERGAAPAPKHETRKPAAEGKRAAVAEEFPADFLAEEDDRSSSESPPVLFQPSIGARLMLGRNHMTDRPNRVLKILFPSLANVVDDLNQKFVTLEFSGQPWKWFGARLSVTTFSYDKDVNEFLAFLSDRRSLGASTFGASVNGLPKSSSALGLYFYPSWDWEIDWIGNSSRSLSTGSLTKGTQLVVSHDFNSWLRAGLGIERDVSDDIGQTLALLNFSFAI